MVEDRFGMGQTDRRLEARKGDKMKRGSAFMLKAPGSTPECVLTRRLLYSLQNIIGCIYWHGVVSGRAGQGYGRIRF